MANQPWVVLNVDDVDSNRYVKSRILRAAGLEVHEAASFESARDWLSRTRPDLVLLDVRLPDGDGRDLCRWIKSRPQTSSVVVLQTSAYLVQPRERAECLEAGADGYVADTIEPEELVAHVRALLRLNRGSAPRAAAPGPLSEAGITIAALSARGTDSQLQEVIERFDERLRLFEAVVSTTPDFAYVFDLHGRFLYANRRLLEVWGMTLPEVVGKTCLELGYERWHHDMHMDEIATVIRTGQAIKGEVPFRAPRTGVFGVYEYIFTPVVSDGGQIEFIAGTTRDVTERKSAEEALRDSDRRKENFIAMLSHELRGPLAALSGALSVIERAGDQPEMVERARQIMWRQLAQLTRLIDDLLDVNRINTGTIELKLADVDISEVIRQALESSKHLLGERRVEVRFPPGRLHVRGDFARLTQVLTNLLHNACKFTRPAGRIDVRAEGEGRYAAIAVADDGVGIPSEKLPFVFDLYAQVDEARDRGFGGLGIGLALVKQLVQLHAGTVTAESPGAGGGTTITVRVPLATEPGQPD